MRKLLFAVAVFGLVGCTGAQDMTSADPTEQDIQGGTVDANDPAVGLVWFEGGGFCTGTLIAPDVVLTAAHCVQDKIAGFYTGEGQAVPEPKMGTLPPSGMTKHDVDNQAAHPSYQANSCPNTTFDLGLIHLSKPITDVTPVKFATSTADVPGGKASCKAVGYGTNGSGANVTVEQKRTATETVESVNKTYITVTADSGLADKGDSGGPLICDGAIVGATSCHTDGDWPQHKTEHYARVDAAADWVQSTVSSWQ